eukprot:TRINITY_DN8805_c2_g1_i1.p2 TRINITY_DN8805_c2_g1~~TRINITY_DN8805_c2_g1_i1.p2  ORF type:complete len:344 (-),score=112.41 TRINITY_DN8805_c2_g1_i1:582-1544(-)
MVFLKVIKDKAYHKRFQTKFRRRREGKTDYYARKRLIAQAKNKYHAHKYRLIVRFTNQDIVCQIAYSTITGDFITAAAYSHELPRYGITLGLTNYAATYATGLLLARRVLTKLNLNQKFQGKQDDVSVDYTVKSKYKGRNPFTCLLDVGLARTTTGCRVFAALKGMCDGGVRVPHSESRFIGYKNGTLDGEVLRKYIYGGHVAAYMSLLLKKNPAKYDTQFSRYKKAGIKPADLEKIYTEAHKHIRANPVFKKKPAKKYTAAQKRKFAHKRRITLAERKGRVKCKLLNYGIIEHRNKKQKKTEEKKPEEKKPEEKKAESQ